MCILHKFRKIINIHVKGKDYKTISKQLCIPLTTAELKKYKIYKIVANHRVRMWMQEEMQYQVHQMDIADRGKKETRNHI